MPIRIRDREGKIDTHYTDYILELKKNRLFIRTTKPLPADTEVDIEFNLKDIKRRVVLKGEIVRTSKGTEVGARLLGAGMGIVFEQADQDDIKILKENLHSFERVYDDKEYEHFRSWVQTLKTPLTKSEKEKIKREFLSAVFEPNDNKGVGAQARPVHKAVTLKPAGEIEPLKKIQLFEDLSDEELSLLVDACHKEVFKSGEKIFEEGAIGDKFYMIQKGEVRISKIIQGIGEEALVVLKEGAYFGEMALIDEAPRSATAICNTNASLLVMDKDDFETLLRVNSVLASKLLWTFVRTLSVRLRETNEKIKSFFAMTGGNQW